MNNKETEHEIGLTKLLEAVIRYECDFCHKLFPKLSECAKHIEEESITGFAGPDDISITVIDLTKEGEREDDAEEKPK